VLDGAATKVIGNIQTGPGAHGLYPSRDASQLYVTNRKDNSVSVLDSRTGAYITKWHIPGPSSPDMGGVTADGTQLWLSGRYNNEVYVMSTADGHLLARIKVAKGPHGLCVWPQPGRYSLGHTGVTR
jgi:YVTN family beta-propeller protein